MPDFIDLLKYTGSPDTYDAPDKQDFNHIHDATSAKGCVLQIANMLLVTLFGEGSGCPYESGGGSAILTGSAIIPRGHPQGGRHAGRRALVPARSGPEDDLHSLLAGAV